MGRQSASARGQQPEAGGASQQQQQPQQQQQRAPPSESEPSVSGREEHLRMLEEYRKAWEPSGSLLQRTARRVHRFLWWLMCFTGLDVLDRHERVLFALGYAAVLALVLLGAAKQAQALAELWRRLQAQRAGGGGAR